MKKDEAINIMWYNLSVALARTKKQLDALELAVRFKNPEKSGENIKELLKEAIEIYTRIGVIAALEEIS